MSFFCFHPGNVETSDLDAGKFLEVTLIKIYDVIFVHIQYHVYIRIASCFYVELKILFLTFILNITIFGNIIIKHDFLP